MNVENETQLLELKPGGQMEVMKSGVCLDVDAKDKLQLVNGKVAKGVSRYLVIPAVLEY